MSTRTTLTVSRATAATAAVLPAVGNHEIESGMGATGYDGFLARMPFPGNGLPGLPTAWNALPERAPWSAFRYNDHSLLLIDVALRADGTGAGSTTTMTVRAVSAAGAEFDRLTLVRRSGAAPSAVQAVAPPAGSVAVSSSVRCAGLYRARERRSPSFGPSHANQFPSGGSASCPR